MMIRLKLEDHLDRAKNFISWKSSVLILEEKDLLKLFNEKVREPDAEKKSLIERRVIPE